MAADRSRKKQSSTKKDDEPTSLPPLKADPRKKNSVLIICSIVLFAIWFAFLAYVAFFR